MPTSGVVEIWAQRHAGCHWHPLKRRACMNGGLVYNSLRTSEGYLCREGCRSGRHVHMGLGRWKLVTS